MIFSSKEAHEPEKSDCASLEDIDSCPFLSVVRLEISWSFVLLSVLFSSVLFEDMELEDVDDDIVDEGGVVLEKDEAVVIEGLCTTGE